jgi:hypothetical protein
MKPGRGVDQSPTSSAMTFIFTFYLYAIKFLTATQFSSSIISYLIKGKGKSKVYHITGHEGPDME